MRKWARENWTEWEKAEPEWMASMAPSILLAEAAAAEKREGRWDETPVAVMERKERRREHEMRVTAVKAWDASRRANPSSPVPPPPSPPSPPPLAGWRMGREYDTRRRTARSSKKACVELMAAEKKMDEILKRMERKERGEVEVEVKVEAEVEADVEAEVKGSEKETENAKEPKEKAPPLALQFPLFSASSIHLSPPPPPLPPSSPSRSSNRITLAKEWQRRRSAARRALATAAFAALGGTLTLAGVAKGLREAPPVRRALCGGEVVEEERAKAVVEGVFTRMGIGGDGKVKAEEFEEFSRLAAAEFAALRREKEGKGKGKENREAEERRERRKEPGDLARRSRAGMRRTPNPTKGAKAKVKSSFMDEIKGHR